MKNVIVKIKMWIKEIMMSFRPYNNVKHMFDNINVVNVENLNLSSANITNMKHMFDNCQGKRMGLL